LRLARPDQGSAATDPESTEYAVRADGGTTSYDLEIELPGYVYFRLGLDRRKDVDVSIRREVVHVVADGDA
jgi:hypothetical protein